jgi:RyR domain
VVMTGSPSLDARFAHALYELHVRRELRTQVFVEVDDVDGLRGASGEALPALGDGLEWFSLADRAAKSLLDELDELLAVKDGQHGQQQHRHLVVVGATPVGRSVIVQAARNWSRDLSRRQHRVAGRLVLTLVEPSTGSGDELRRREDDERRLLRRRDPRVPTDGSTFGELYVEACDLAQEELADRFAAEPSAVVVTAGNDHDLLARAMAVTASVARPVPVWLCTERSGGIVDLVAEPPMGSRRRRVDVFPVLDTVLREDGVLRGTDEELARAVHQAHRRYRRSAATQMSDLDTVRPWDELSTDLRALNHATVAAWRRVLASYGFRFAPYSTLGAESAELAPDLVEALAVAAHMAWSAEKKRQGYQRGLRRNDDASKGSLTHPEVDVPYAHLSDDGQEWNRSQAAAVPEHLAAAGLQLDPLPAEPSDPGVVTLPHTAIDALAAAMHELYRTQEPTATSWAELSPDLRESNRAAARALPEQLGQLGYRIVPRSSVATPPAVTELPNHEVEVLAAAEHERWMGDRRAQGFVHGRSKDEDANPPTHPDLVPWADLDEATRDKDRIHFVAAARLLADVGYAIVRDAPA